MNLSPCCAAPVYRIVENSSHETTYYCKVCHRECLPLNTEERHINVSQKSNHRVRDPDLGYREEETTWEDEHGTLLEDPPTQNNGLIPYLNFDMLQPE
jgi:hypothetical protein